MSSKIASFLQLIRVPAGFSIISNVLVAHILATQGEIKSQELIFSLIASLFLYFGGMILNDCFDFPKDCQVRPERPLPSQQINRKTAWILGYTFLALGCLSTAFINQQMFVISIILILLILLYDSNQLSPWPSAITMGLCRYTNWTMALAVLPLSMHILVIPIPIFLYVISLTRLSQFETSLALKPPIYEILIILVLAFISLMFLTKLTLISSLFLIILGGYYLFLILPLIKSHTPKQIQQIVSRLIFGLIPFDALICLAFGYWETAIIVLLLIPISRSIGHRLYIS